MQKSRRFKSLDDLHGLHQTLVVEAKTKEIERIKAQELAQARQQEMRLFEKTVGEVKPIKPHGRYEIIKPKPPALPLQRWKEEKEVLKASLSDNINIELLLETDDQLSFRQQGIGGDVIKKLRRGQWMIKAELDLHGLRVDEARTAVANFIRHAYRSDKRCVRIIHGKGHGSIGKTSVLKDKVYAWLVQKEEVLAFCQAPPKDGGAGAVWVLLKSQ